MVIEKGTSKEWGMSSHYCNLEEMGVVSDLEIGWGQPWDMIAKVKNIGICTQGYSRDTVRTRSCWTLLAMLKAVTST